jgi:protein-S-isoprenylcysteine O-methyltransferase Ste14
MLKRSLLQRSASCGSAIAAVVALVLLICGVMLVMPEQLGTSDCCAAIRSFQPQVPVSPLAVLSPTILVLWLFAMSSAFSQVPDHHPQFSSPRVLCLLC